MTSKILRVIVVCLCVSVSLWFLLSVRADSPDDDSEFYFTRLMYRQNPILHGFFQPFTMANPGRADCN